MTTIKGLLQKFHNYKPYRLKRMEDGTYSFRFWPTWVGIPQWGFGNTAEEAILDAINRARAGIEHYIEINRIRTENYKKHLDEFNNNMGF
jgi:hypothetical protein